MKAYVIKHEPSNTYVTVSDEIGPISVNLEDTQLFSFEVAESILEDIEYIEGIEDQVNPEDLSIYQVEIIILNKVK